MLKHCHVRYYLNRLYRKHHKATEIDWCPINWIEETVYCERGINFCLFSRWMNYWLTSLTSTCTLPDTETDTWNWGDSIKCVNSESQGKQMLQAGDYFYDAPERFHNSVGIWENSEGRPHAYALREAVGKSQNCRVCWLLVTVATFKQRLSTSHSYPHIFATSAYKPNFQLP